MKPRVLLTGATGMVGRNILAHSKANQFTWLTPGRAELNLLQAEHVAGYIQHTQPDWVIHAAGKVGGIQANVAHPVDFLSDNMLMGHHVVMGALQAQVKRLINLGSSCMYPRNIDGFLTEDLILSAPLEPTNEGYALGKLVTARLCDYITVQYGAAYQYKTLLPCNLYGRWDHFDPRQSHLIAAIIQKMTHAMAQNATEVEIWGDGQARREFMYAGDLADCLLHILSEPQRFATLPQLTNVGLGYDYTVLEYYQAVAQLLGYLGQFRFDTTRPVGMSRKLLSVDCLSRWGWNARTPLTEGLQQTIQFYQQQQQEVTPC